MLQADSQEMQEKALMLLKMHRRALHQIPELGFEVYKTRQYILDALQAYAPDEICTFAGTGIRTIFRCREAKRTIAFRSDMDALPIAESNAVPYRSKHDGKMHACGHDGHIANLLTLAAWIAENRERIHCNVVLLFEPAEETTGGAKPMIEEGALRDPNVDVIYGMHMMPDVPKGKVAVCPGPIMAQTSELNFTIKGRAAHGAYPHLGRDAVCAMAHLIVLLQTLVARTVDPCKEALITIGKIEAGTQRNVIADCARLEGICRTFSNEVYDGLEKRIYNACAAVEQAFDVQVEFTRGVYYPCTCNDEKETARIIALLGDHYTPAIPRMTAEDFSFYQLEVPGVFVFCGCMDENHNSPLHSSSFDFDEESLFPGFMLFVRILQTEAER